MCSPINGDVGLYDEGVKVGGGGLEGGSHRGYQEHEGQKKVAHSLEQIRLSSVKWLSVSSTQPAR